MTKNEMHVRALSICESYRRNEFELLEILELMDQARIFLDYGEPSLFSYAVNKLRLSEGVSLNLINVMRKAREIAALKAAVGSGRIHLSNARKIVPVITVENQDEWILKAETLSQRELEREIAKVRPEALQRERIKPVDGKYSRVEFYFTEEELADLERVKDLLKEESLQEVFKATLKFFIRANDPVEKAKRAKARAASSSAVKPKEKKPSVALQRKRSPLSAEIKRAVYARDKGRCSAMKDGKRCSNTRYTEIHHRKPVSEGGKDTVENLETLCWQHHRWVHEQQTEENSPYDHSERLNFI